MEIQLLRKWIFLSSIYHLNMICDGYNTGLHQYTPITSYQGIKCGGDFQSAESLEKAMQACDRLEKCTSIATDLNWHRAFPIDERDYDHGCGKAGHHYIETFHLCEGNIHSKYSGVFDCAFTRGRIVYFDLVLGVEVVILEYILSENFMFQMITLRIQTKVLMEVRTKYHQTLKTHILMYRHAIILCYITHNFALYV